MNPLEYARLFIYLWQSSPVSGPFSDDKYPFVRAPLMALDDIFIKCLVLFGPTQSFKTVFLQIAAAFILDMRRKSLLVTSQTDDDALEFAKVKLLPFIKRIDALMATVQDNRSATTLKNWLWATHELIISGPGENAAQSKSVAYWISDEAHRYCLSNPGAMSALRNRMGDRWDRMEIHATTAPHAGTEVDILYADGAQNEWHLSCVFCGKPIWPLWMEASKAHYNGAQVFQWEESQSETATLDSITMVCPHCDKQIADTRRNRIGLDEGALYLPQNTKHDRATTSFRWNAFAPRWKPFRDLFAKYRGAIASYKMGDLVPYKNWVTMQEVRSWTGEYPVIGDGGRNRNYRLGEIQVEVVEPEKFRTLSADQQEAGGFHLICQLDEWDRQGNSKRLFWGQCATYADMDALAKRYSVANREKGRIKAVAIDYGQGIREREIFDACSRFRWLAMKSGDDASFAHVIRCVGRPNELMQLPYSEERRETSLIGKKEAQHITLNRDCIPPGWCVSRMWSKPAIYALFYALKRGDTGREYGIASDIDDEFVRQVNAYIPSDTKDPVTNLPKPIKWIKTRDADHAWVTACQGLVLAIVAGFYPLSLPEKQILQIK